MDTRSKLFALAALSIPLGFSSCTPEGPSIDNLSVTGVEVVDTPAGTPSAMPVVYAGHQIKVRTDVEFSSTRNNIPPNGVGVMFFLVQKADFDARTDPEDPAFDGFQIGFDRFAIQSTGTSSFDTYLTLPTTVAPAGEWIVAVLIDPGTEIAEENEDDNSPYEAANTTVIVDTTYATTPDIAIQAVEINSTLFSPTVDLSRDPEATGWLQDEVDRLLGELGIPQDVTCGHEIGISATIFCSGPGAGNVDLGVDLVLPESISSKIPSREELEALLGDDLLALRVRLGDLQSKLLALKEALPLDTLDSVLSSLEAHENPEIAAFGQLLRARFDEILLSFCNAVGLVGPDVVVGPMEESFGDVPPELSMSFGDLESLFESANPGLNIDPRIPMGFLDVLEGVSDGLIPVLESGESTTVQMSMCIPEFRLEDVNGFLGFTNNEFAERAFTAFFAARASAENFVATYGAEINSVQSAMNEVADLLREKANDPDVNFLLELAMEAAADEIDERAMELDSPEITGDDVRERIAEAAAKLRAQGIEFIRAFLELEVNGNGSIGELAGGVLEGFGVADANSILCPVNIFEGILDELKMVFDAAEGDIVTPEPVTFSGGYERNWSLPTPRSAQHIKNVGTPAIGIAPSAWISCTVDTEGARVTADGDVPFTILGATVSVASVDGLLDHRANYDAETGLHDPMNFLEFDVRFLGQTVASEPPREELTIEYMFDILKFEKEYEKKKIFVVGGIPLTASAKAVAEAKLVGSASMGIDGAKVGLTPEFTVSVALGAGVEAGLARVEVVGTLELLKLEFPNEIDANLVFAQDIFTGNPVLNARLGQTSSVVISALSGDVKVVLQTGPPETEPDDCGIFSWACEAANTVTSPTRYTVTATLFKWDAPFVYKDVLFAREGLIRIKEFPVAAP